MTTIERLNDRPTTHELGRKVFRSSTRLTTALSVAVHLVEPFTTRSIWEEFVDEPSTNVYAGISDLQRLRMIEPVRSGSYRLQNTPYCMTKSALWNVIDAAQVVIDPSQVTPPVERSATDLSPDLVGRLLFGKKIRFQLGAWMARQPDDRKVVSGTNIAKATHWGVSSVNAGLRELEQLGLLDVNRNLGLSRSVFYRPSNHPAWSIFEAAAQAMPEGGLPSPFLAELRPPGPWPQPTDPEARP